LAFGVDGELALELAARHRGHHLGDIAHLAGEVRRHHVDVVGEVLPDAGDALHLRLAAELALDADFARDARDLGGEGVELVHHGVDGGLELQDLALDVDGDLLGQVPGRDGGGDIGDIAHLAGEVRRHHVDVVGQVLPNAADAADLRLAAELTLAADLPGDAGDLRGKGVELVHHGVDGGLELEDLALDRDRDLLRQVAVGDRRRHVGDVTHLARQIGGHAVDVVGQALPHAADAAHLRLAAELAFAADFARDTRHLGGEGVELIHHRVDGGLELEDLALDIDGDLLGEVAIGDRGRHVGDVAHLPGEVRRHQVDVVGQVLPYPADAFDARLAAELAFAADLACDARHLRGEGVELVHHGVDGGFELEYLAFDVDGDFLRQVAIGDRRGDFGDVAHLAGEVRRHHVDVVGQVIPHAADAAHLRLAAELAFGADLARDARHLRSEGVELIHHGIDGGLELEDLALDVDGDFLRQVAIGDRRRDVGDVADLPGEV